MTNSEHAVRTHWANHEFIARAGNITEALANLNYLIELDSGDAGKVRSYAHLAEERLHALEDLLRSARWNDRSRG